MSGIARFALFLLPLVNARPQGIGVVICDSNPIGPLSYQTAGHQDVTENVGDHGWFNYDSQVCSSSTQSCQRQEGTELSVEVGVSFNVGAAFDLGEAVESGLDFGVSVAYTTTKTESTVEPCPASENNKDACVCGIQYKNFMQEAWGSTKSSTDCGESVAGPDFDVTAPVMKDGKPWSIWRACRSTQSTCQNAADLPLCADGI